MAFIINTYHGKYNIFSRAKSSIKYIVVHYVGAGTSSAGSALANCKYFAGGNRNASAHYFIDDEYIYEYANPATYGCWHVGDGKGKYGITNTNSIGIEVCNNGGAFTKAEIARLSFLTQKLMKDFNIDSEHVVRHYDASRKQCPAYYAKNGTAWKKLKATITGTTSTSNTNTNSESGFDMSKLDSFYRNKDKNTYHKEVVCLQACLNAQGFGKLDTDGYYGSATADAVESFQKKNGLTADRVCGPATWACLFGV